MDAVEKQLFYFFECWILRWKKNECAVYVMGFPVVLFEVRIFF